MMSRGHLSMQWNHSTTMIFHFKSYSQMAKWPNPSVRINILDEKLNFPKMINCWSNFPNCIFLAAVCADQVYLVSFRTIQQAGRGHPGAIFADFWPKPLHTRQFLTKAEIFVTLRQPLTVFWNVGVNFLQVLARSGWSKGNSKCLNSKEWKRWWDKRQVTNICLKKEFKNSFLASDVCF